MNLFGSEAPNRCERDSAHDVVSCVVVLEGLRLDCFISAVEDDSVQLTALRRRRSRPRMLRLLWRRPAMLSGFAT